MRVPADVLPEVVGVVQREGEIVIRGPDGDFPAEGVRGTVDLGNSIIIHERVVIRENRRRLLLELVPGCRVAPDGNLRVPEPGVLGRGGKY